MKAASRGLLDVGSGIVTDHEDGVRFRPWVPVRPQCLHDMVVQPTLGLGIADLGADEHMVEQLPQPVIVEHLHERGQRQIKVADQHEGPVAGLGLGGQHGHHLLVGSLGQSLDRQLDLDDGVGEVLGGGPPGAGPWLQERPHLGCGPVESGLGIEAGGHRALGCGLLGSSSNLVHGLDRTAQIEPALQMSSRDPFDLLGPDRSGHESVEIVDEDPAGIELGQGPAKPVSIAHRHRPSTAVGQGTVDTAW